ncbi:MAG: hypothetical protein HY423_13420 [Candidatus Lambdaproteobacteria bacterium]|nr:hypothetical protein [Candidatus Lambdaproteobacteria bacterium]
MNGPSRMLRAHLGSVLAFLAAAMALLLLRPATLLEGLGHPEFPALVHLLTLGGLLGGAYALYQRLLPALCGRPPAWPALGAAIWLFQAGGVALVAAGFAARQPGLANLGGHYLVPAGIVLAFGQAAATLWRRPPGVPRRAAVLLPQVGLLATMSLGAMLVLDAYQGGYGLYTPPTILLHGLAGAFLFVLPLLLLADVLDDPAPAEAAGAPAPLLLTTALAALGLLALALAQTRPGYALAAPLGLALLGGVAIWIGLPGWGGAGTSRQEPGGAGRPHPAFAPVRRMPWAAFGAVVLYGAIRLWRGSHSAEPLGAELASLARFGLVLFLFAAALPDLLSRLGPPPAAGAPALPLGPETAIEYVVQLVAAGLIVGALLAQAALLVQAGALLWLATLAWRAWRLLRRS